MATGRRCVGCRGALAEGSGEFWRRPASTEARNCRPRRLSNGMLERTASSSAAHRPAHPAAR
eukprot:scaffold7995_cov941-Prasinococcus_capsulatus_cf.AAC.1